MKLVLIDAGRLAEAEAALDAVEREALAGYTFEKRRRDWLLGRLAAKLAVQAVTGAPTGIRSEENGHPTATGLPPGWDLSLTHGHGFAGAICAPAPVGVDLELLRAVPPNGWRFFLTPAERDWLAGEPLGPHGEIIAWALKEAAYKAVQGRTEGMHHLTLDEVADGRARIGHPAGTLEARYQLGSRFCLAIASPVTGWLADVTWPQVP
ncbi:MAG: 4-phosphopantetheinyl transferase [Cyanobacteria bacterium RYN_339]|nr:4-phosphopantetheinyl transferase [Cyanobacteria bacterium RYN_339]